jgi:hypothetical protein
MTWIQPNNLLVEFAQGSNREIKIFSELKLKLEFFKYTLKNMFGFLR